MHAWLIHLPGTTRRHEVFTADLLAMDRSNLQNLVAVMQDSVEDDEASSRTLSFSPCFLNSTGRESPTDGLRNSLFWQVAMSDSRNPSLLLLYSQEAKVANRQKGDGQASVGSNSRTARGTSKRIEASCSEAEAQRHGAEGNEGYRRKATTIPSFFLDRQATSLSEHSQEALDKDGKLAMMEGIPAWLACHSVAWLCRAKDSCPSGRAERAHQEHATCGDPPSGPHHSAPCSLSFVLLARYGCYDRGGVHGVR
jgi:hypothetical protein